MNGVGNVGYKKFCSWPLRCRDLRPPALPGGPSSKQQMATRPAAYKPYNPYNVVLWWGAMWAVSTQPARSLALGLFA